MNGKVSMSSDYIHGITCVVNTCKYHGKDNHCYASAIEVEPKNADNTEITDCATFAHE
jgi:hypothetical protein